MELNHEKMQQVWSELNDRGLGYPVGPPDYDIEDLTGEDGLDEVLAVSGEGENRVVAYSRGCTDEFSLLTLVADSNGPWAVNAWVWRVQ